MKTIVKAALMSFAISAGTLSTVNLAYAADPVVAATTVETTQSGSFEKTSFKIKGDWEIVKENGQTIFRLSDDFKTKNGPDLKLFLSPKTVGNVTGATATQGAVKLSVLRSNKGSQDYIIPSDIDLSQYGSILIHCEAYSKLWGGANL